MMLYGLMVLIQADQILGTERHHIWFQTPDERSRFLAQTHLGYLQYQYINAEYSLDENQPEKNAT
jgi:hypothetical protein